MRPQLLQIRVQSIALAKLEHHQNEEFRANYTHNGPDHSHLYQNIFAHHRTTHNVAPDRVNERVTEWKSEERTKKQIHFNKVLWLSNICQANKSRSNGRHSFTSYMHGMNAFDTNSSTYVYMHIECENVKRPQKQTEQFSLVLLKN